MDITPRQLKILHAIIDDYILTGMPVGSRTLSKREDLKLSPATIRNEMADLEESGYLEQPHTSAGRMPSEKAYRLYVDALMEVSRLPVEQIEHIHSYFNGKMDEIEQVVERTAKALSETTHLTALVLAPELSKIEIKRIQIVKLSETKGLLLFVFNTGIVKDTMIPIAKEMDNQYLEMLSNMLTERVANLTLAEAATAIKEILTRDIRAHRTIAKGIMDAVTQNVNRHGAKQVILGGAQNIFNHPEYKDVDKAKNFLALLEAKDTLYDLLKQAADMEFTIRIGKETGIQELSDMSVVTATYKIAGKKIGSFGVIGPTRMDYGKVLSVLACVGSSMDEILSGYLKSD